MLCRVALQPCSRREFSVHFTFSLRTRHPIVWSHRPAWMALHASRHPSSWQSGYDQESLALLWDELSLPSSEPERFATW